MEELLTDVMLEKQSRQSHKIGAVVRNRLNDKSTRVILYLQAGIVNTG